MSSLPAWWDEGLPRPDSEQPYLRLHHWTVFVRDQDRSLRFYVEKLGFTLVIDYRFGELARFVVVAPPDGTAVIGIVAPRPDSEEYKLIGQQGLAVFVTDDIHAEFQAWSERGVRFRHPPRAEPWGGTVTMFEDVDGNSFVLAAWDDMTREVEERRRAIAKRLEAERRAAQELEIAKQVQARLFPQTAPAIASLDYAGLCIQAREVGGDHYDYLNLGPGRLGLVIGDISGKGMAAALLMANLQANLRSQYTTGFDHPEQFLQNVNRLFYENTTDSAYATLFFAVYDEERRLRYANCGHVSALLLRDDHSVQWLASTATVLGLFERWDSSIEQHQLFRGDTLVLYTDGVTESFNALGEDFGEQRLVEIVLRHHELPAHDMAAAVVDEVEEFSGRQAHDDITVIVAKCM